MPNQKGIQRLTGMKEEEVAKLIKVEKEGKFAEEYTGAPNDFDDFWENDFD
jgi:hypothetical protein